MRLSWYVPVLAVAALTAWSGECCAQAKVPYVGVLTLSKAALEQTSHQAFTRGLVERGWVPGNNIVLEYRFARGEDMRFNEGAEELVRLKVVRRANFVSLNLQIEAPTRILHRSQVSRPRGWIP